MTSSGTSAATTIASDNGSYICRIATTGNIWVKFGTSPTAEAGGDFLMTEGSYEYFNVPAGYKVAVIDA